MPADPENLTNKELTMGGLFVALVAVSIATAALLEHFGEQGRGRVAFLFVVAMGLTLWATWRFKSSKSYWVTIVALVATHTMVVVLIDWPRDDSSPRTLFPYGVADLLASGGLVHLVQKAKSKKTS